MTTQHKAIHQGAVANSHNVRFRAIKPNELRLFLINGIMADINIVTITKAVIATLIKFKKIASLPSSILYFPAT